MRTAEIGRLGDRRTKEVPDGMTVGEFLTHCDYTMSEGERITTEDGRAVDLTEEVGNGQSYVIARNVKSGCGEDE